MSLCGRRQTRSTVATAPDDPRGPRVIPETKRPSTLGTVVSQGGSRQSFWWAAGDKAPIIRTVRMILMHLRDNYLAPSEDAKYCDRVSACMCVCIGCLCARVSQKPRVETLLNIVRMFSVAVAGSSLTTVQCVIRTSGFADDVMFAHSVALFWRNKQTNK